MYAIIATGGKQYKVSENDIVQIERLNVEAGEKINFDKVLMVGDTDSIKVGRPYLENAKVEGEVVEQGRAPKILVFKKKRRKGYKKIRGHRQCFTGIKVLKINA